MKLLIIVVILLSIFIIFYGGYYIINPSLQGKDIASRLGIPYPSVIAHRGASIIAPESTAPAYIKARDDGADYLEADLQRTKDGKIVVFHDQTLQRTSNVEEVFPDRKNDGIGSFTYDELKKLDFGSWFNDAYPEYAKTEYEDLDIIKLEDLIDIVETGENRPGLVLELKHPKKYPGIEKEIVEILNKKGCLDSTQNNDEKDSAKIIFFAFNLESLESLKELVPQIPRVLLITDNMITKKSWNQWLDRAEETVHGLGTKGFVNWPLYIAAAHDKGLFVFPYTINKLWQMKVLAYFQSSGYITDRPEVVLEFLDRIPELPEINDESD
ncbi:MAG: glycerophosphodiester phosphodiesterase family protein [Bacillota bacterium]